MNTVSKADGFRRTSLSAAAITPASTKIEPQHTAQREDFVKISQDGRQHINWSERTQDTLDALGKQFPHINTVIRESENKSNLAQIAAAAGGGKHLLISQSFLDKMSGSEQGYYECTAILEQVLGQISSGGRNLKAIGAYLDADGVTLWSAANTPKPEPNSPQGANAIPSAADNLKNLLDKMRESLQSSKVRPGFGTIAITKNFSMLGRSARSIANASNRLQVQTAVSQVYKDINSLQMMVTQGTKEESAKATMAIRSLRKMITRGNRKVQQLDDERTTMLQRKRAQEEARLEKAIRLAQELQKQRTRRSANDRAMVEQSDEDTQSINHFRYEDDIALTIPGAPIPEPLPIIAADIGVASAPIDAASITVAETISFA